MKIAFYFIFFLTSLYSQKTIRVCLVETDKAVQITFNHVAVLYADEARYQLTKQNQPTYIYAKNGYIVIESKGQYPRNLKYSPESKLILRPINESNSIQIMSDFIENGPITFNMNDDKLQVIAEMTMQRYLNFVVPNEIIAKESKHYEAIKAQTVAARSYALSKADLTRPFDVYADVRDQVYRSAMQKVDLVENAILETDGIVLKYNDDILLTKFCSSLGGRKTYPSYLSGDSVFLDVTNPDGKYIGMNSPLYRWERRFNLYDLHQRLQQWFPDTFAITDSLLDIQLMFTAKERDLSGRVTTFIIADNDKSVELSKLDIRRFFHENQKILPSNLFTYHIDQNELVIFGGGNGHGEGLGQYEAMEMSEMRYNFLQILDYFYPKTEAVWLEY